MTKVLNEKIKRPTLRACPDFIGHVPRPLAAFGCRWPGLAKLSAFQALRNLSTA